MQPSVSPPPVRAVRVPCRSIAAGELHPLEVTTIPAFRLCALDYRQSCLAIQLHVKNSTENFIRVQFLAFSNCSSALHGVLDSCRRCDCPERRLLSGTLFPGLIVSQPRRARPNHRPDNQKIGRSAGICTESKTLPVCLWTRFPVWSHRQNRRPRCRFVRCRHDKCVHLRTVAVTMNTVTRSNYEKCHRCTCCFYPLLWTFGYLTRSPASAISNSFGLSSGSLSPAAFCARPLEILAREFTRPVRNSVRRLLTITIAP